MRTSITILLGLMLTGPTMAQDNDKEEKSHGLRAGWHYSNFSGDLDTDPRHGWYFGYYHNWIKVPMVSFSTGLEANTAGAVLDPSEFRLTYLTLPINGRLKLGPVYFDLGVDAALMLSEKFLIDGEEFPI